MANRFQPLSRITTIQRPFNQGGENEENLPPRYPYLGRSSGSASAAPTPEIDQFWKIYKEVTTINDETPIARKEEGFSKLFAFAVTHRLKLGGKVCFKATLENGLSTAKCAEQFNLLKNVAFIHQTLNPGAVFPHIVQALGHFINGDYLPAFGVLNRNRLDLNKQMAHSIAELVQTYKLENPTTSNHLLNLLQFFSEQHSKSDLMMFHSTLRV